MSKMKFTKKYLSHSQPDINYLTHQLPSVRTRSRACVVTCPWIFPIRLEPTASESVASEYRDQLNKFLDMGCFSQMFRFVYIHDKIGNFLLLVK